MLEYELFPSKFPMKEAYRQKQLILKQLKDDLKFYQSQKDVQMMRMDVIQIKYTCIWMCHTKL